MKMMKLLRNSLLPALLGLGLVAFTGGCYEELDGGSSTPATTSGTDSSGTRSASDSVSGGNPSLGKAKQSAQNLADNIEQQQQDLADRIDDGEFDGSGD